MNCTFSLCSLHEIISIKRNRRAYYTNYYVTYHRIWNITVSVSDLAQNGVNVFCFHLLICVLKWLDNQNPIIIVNNVPTKRNVEDDDSQQEDFNCCSRNTLRIQTAVYSFLKTHTNLIKTVIKTVLLGVFFAYLGYAFYCYSGLSFLIAPSVFSNVYFILCTLYCQLLWIVLFDCPFGIL
jgi:hypothetical protein